MKTLKEIYGLSKTRKLSNKELRKIIAEEVKILKEEEEEGKSEEAASGTTFTAQSNFKDFDDPMIDELFKQIKSKDPSASIYKAMEFKDGENTVSPDPEKVAAWLESKGEDAVRERIKLIGSKIPDTGLPKSDMPFLPGPKDAAGEVSQLVDALDGAGGEFSVDIEAPFSEEEEEVKEESWIKGVNVLLEKELPAKNSFVGLDDPEAQAFMTGGKKDKEKSDDTIQVVPGGGMPASKAIPTQTNILLPKALGMAVAGIEGGDLKAYASLENEILDGHHRWAATTLNNPSAEINTIAKVDLKKFGRDDTLKILTLVGNALGNKTKTESRTRNNKDKLVMERWRRLAGLL